MGNGLARSEAVLGLHGSYLNSPMCWPTHYSQDFRLSVLVHSDVDVLELAQDEDENIIYLLRSLLGLLPMFPLSVQCSVRVSLPIECV